MMASANDLVTVDQHWNAIVAALIFGAVVGMIIGWIECRIFMQDAHRAEIDSLRQKLERFIRMGL